MDELERLLREEGIKRDIEARKRLEAQTEATQAQTAMLAAQNEAAVMRSEMDAHVVALSSAEQSMQALRVELAKSHHAKPTEHAIPILEEVPQEEALVPETDVTEDRWSKAAQGVLDEAKALRGCLAAAQEERDEAMSCAEELEQKLKSAQEEVKQLTDELDAMREELTATEEALQDSMAQAHWDNEKKDTEPDEDSQLRLELKSLREEFKLNADAMGQGMTQLKTALAEEQATNKALQTKLEEGGLIEGKPTFHPSNAQLLSDLEKATASLEAMQGRGAVQDEVICVLEGEISHPPCSPCCGAGAGIFRWAR